MYKYICIYTYVYMISVCGTGHTLCGCVFESACACMHACVCVCVFVGNKVRAYQHSTAEK